jgi:DNA ligase-associated metallophosphoesterase
MANRCILWINESTLILSDLHLGKASHFQKSGLPIPSIKGHEDLNRIANVIFDTRPDKVIFLGDLFHSATNEEWNWFTTWMEHFPDLKFILVEGNHDTDILNDIPKNLSTTAEYEKDQIIFTHEPLNPVPEGLFNIAGHNHPGVVIKGKGRQSLKLPCFWEVKNLLILPAFGNLTGSVKMPTKNARHYAIAEDQIFKV